MVSSHINIYDINSNNQRLKIPKFQNIQTKFLLFSIFSVGGGGIEKI